MHGLMTLSAVLGLAVLSAAIARAQPEGGLQPGDQAPAFTLPGSDGRTYSLAEFANSRAVVLAWFPKAFTGG